MVRSAQLDARPTQVKIFFCPSNRTDGVIDMSFLVPIAGRPLPNLAATDYLLCKGANAALCEVTQVPPAGRGVFDVNTRTTLTDITDGASQTFAGGEGAGNNSRFGIRRFYQDTSPATGFFPGQSPSDRPELVVRSDRDRGVAFAGDDGRFIPGSDRDEAVASRPLRRADEPRLAFPAFDYNQGCANGGTAPGTYDTTAGFRSVHPGGCQFLFCDGSVRFMPRDIAPATYRAFSTIAGGEVIGDR